MTDPANLVSTLERCRERLAHEGNGNSTRDGAGNVLLHKLQRRRDGMFSEAYLHEFYAPLSQDDISNLEVQVGRVLPAELSALYTFANGFSIFFGSLSIAGLRRNYDRISRAPVSLTLGNSVEIPKLASDHPNRLRFGFYAADPGFDLCWDSDLAGPIIVLPRRQQAPVLRQWSSLCEFLETELRRLQLLYDACSAEVDPLNPLSL